MGLKNVYNLIRIAAGDEWKAAFSTKQGLFEYTAMPFGLTNAPVLFYETKHTILEDMERCLRYLHDILRSGGNTQAEYQLIVIRVLQHCV